MKDHRHVFKSVGKATIGSNGVRHRLKRCACGMTKQSSRRLSAKCEAGRKSD